MGRPIVFYGHRVGGRAALELQADLRSLAAPLARFASLEPGTVMEVHTHESHYGVRVLESWAQIAIFTDDGTRVELLPDTVRKVIEISVPLRRDCLVKIKCHHMSAARVLELVEHLEEFGQDSLRWAQRVANYKES